MIRQECKTLHGWNEVPVSSATSDQLYFVAVPPWIGSWSAAQSLPDDEYNQALDEIVCECQGYTYRKYCHHQDLAWSRLCDWREDTGIPQTDDQKKSRICPQCGERTVVVIINE